MKDSEMWREILKEMPDFVPEFVLRPRQTALLIIDMQRFGILPQYGLGRILRDRFPELAEYFFDRVNGIVIPNIQRMLTFFRKHNMRVVFLTVGPELPDHSDMFARRKRRDEGRPRGDVTLFARGTFEHGIIDQLVPVPGELVINKNSMGAFNSSNIDQLLRNMGINDLVVAGVGTNACVETTARDAADRGYNVYLIEDACAAIHPRLHEAALISFSLLCGKVRTTTEVVRELETALVPAS